MIGVPRLSGAAPTPGDIAEPTDPPEVTEVTEEPEPPAWEPKRSRHSLHYSNLFALRVNPIGLLDQFRIGYRMALFERPGALFQGTHMDLKLHSYLSPAFARVGPYFEIMPLALLKLSARYTWVGYFGAFDILQSFPSPTADYSPSAIDERGAEDDDYATTGHMVTLTALLQGKVGPVAARSELTAQWSKTDLRGDDTVFYDQTFDVLFPDDSWVLVNELDLLYLFDFGLKLGARYTVTHAFYQSRHYIAGESTSNPNTPHHRLGPAILYTPFDRPGARWNAPTLAVLSQWWIKNRWRTGADVHQAVPYLVVALVFDGQLWPLSPRYPWRRKGR